MTRTMTASTGKGRGRWGPHGLSSVVDGKKYCNGCKRWLPATADYFHRRNDRLTPSWSSRCKECRNKKRIKRPRPAHGMVFVEPIRFVFIELENRLGVTEAQRRINMPNDRFRAIINRRQKTVQKATALRAIDTLREVRRKDEVRHKHSIKRGAYLRGEEELRPVVPNDFYSRQDDSEAERRRRERGQVVKGLDTDSPV